MTLQKPRFAVLTLLVLAAAASRLAPHPPNFSPVAALALFAGAHFADRRAAFGVPLAGLLLSDLALGFYSGMAWVYGSFALIVCLGLALRARRTFWPVTSAALAGSVLFFAVTNFGVWAAGGLYPRTGGGLGACYAAAIPFFQHTLAGDLSYAALLFGVFALAEKNFAALREPAPASAA